MTPNLTTEELAQLHQTIEMFEVIARTQPDDFQSLEILKEAYLKLGRIEESLQISKQLVRAYYTHSQLPSALHECESILVHEPNSVEIFDAIKVLREQLQIDQPQSVPQGMNGAAAHEETAQEQTTPRFNTPTQPAEYEELSAQEHSHTPPRHIDYNDFAADNSLTENGRLALREESPAEPSVIELDFGGPQGGLVDPGEATDGVQAATPAKARRGPDAIAQLAGQDDGTEALARHIVSSGAATREAIEPILQKVLAHNKAVGNESMAVSLIAELARAEILEPESFISDLVGRAQMPFVPLDYYDIDRDTVRMLPPQLTLHRLVLPFDIISRTLLVALSNPLDAAAREALGQSVDFTVHWYLAKPDAIQKHLANAYRIDIAKIMLP